jgi:hypothetical protein
MTDYDGTFSASGKGVRVLIVVLATAHISEEIRRASYAGELGMCSIWRELLTMLT